MSDMTDPVEESDPKVEELIRQAKAGARRVVERLNEHVAGFGFADAEATMQRAAAAVAAGNFAGKGNTRAKMLENHLHEWRMDMRYVDARYRERAMADPDGEFVSWLGERVGRTVWLSAEAQAWALARHPDQSTPALIRIWQAELGWAFRQRGDSDVKTAVLAGVWYRQAMLDTSKYFKKVVEAHLERAVDDGLYLGSAGREMTFFDLMAADRLPDWKPLWRDLAEEEFASIANAPEERLLEEKVRIEQEYHGQLARERSERIALLFLRMRPGRMPSVMKAAVAAGWDAQTLVEAEREFFSLLLARKVEIVDPAGYGDREFVAWIASVRRPKPHRGKAVESARREAFLRGGKGVVEIRNARPVRWMPEEFEVFEHYRTEVLEGWKNALWNGEVGCPETEAERQAAFRAQLDALARINVDRQQVLGMSKESEFVDHPVVVHYGFYLVKQAFDRRAAILAARTGS